MKWYAADRLPTLVLCLFVLLLPWQTRLIAAWSSIAHVPTEFGTLSLYATQFLFLLGLFVMYAVSGAPEIRKQYTVPLLLGAGVCVMTFISAYLADWSIPAIAGLFELGFAALFFFALLDDRVDVKNVMTAFALGLLVPVGVGMIQVFTDGNAASTWLGMAARDARHLGDVVTVLGNGDRILRAYGPFPHPNIFGGYLAVGLLSALGSLQRDRWTAGFLFLLGLGLLLTLSRSAILGLLLGIAVAVFVAKMRNTNLARVLVVPLSGIIIAFALVGTLYAPNLVAQLRGGGPTEERSLAERRVQYEEFPSVMQGADWLLGNGPRNYVFALANEHPGREVWDYQPIHNVPFLILAELGILGVLIVFSWSSSIDRINFLRFPNRDALYAFAMGNVILVTLFFDHYIWSSWAGLALVAYVMALTLRLGEPERV